MIHRKKFDISTISYIRTGGIVKDFFETNNLKEVRDCIKKHHNHDFEFLGNTSKILFAFDYSKKIFLRYTNSQIIDKEKYLVVNSGVKLPLLVSYMCKKGYGGIETLGDIPGLVGGSIVNNSGCFNQALGDLVIAVQVIDLEGYTHLLFKEQLKFSYRHSLFKEKKYFIAKVYLKKIKCDSNFLIENAKFARKKRRETQPHGIKTLGSTFTNPRGISIGKMLEVFGAKNLKTETCLVSQIHANFIEVTTGNSYRNILSLIERCSALLYNKLDNNLHLEIVIIEG